MSKLHKFSEEEKQKMVEIYESSDLSKFKFVVDNHLSYQSFDGWCQLYGVNEDHNFKSASEISDEEKKSLILSFKNSNQSQPEFERSNHLKIGTLKTWLKRESKEKPNEKHPFSEHSKLIDVTKQVKDLSALHDDKILFDLNSFHISISISQLPLFLRGIQNA